MELPEYTGKTGHQTRTYIPYIYIGNLRECARFARSIMAESGELECQYSYTAIKEYLRAVVYPDGYDKQSKHGLRKRSKYFTLEGGHLMYIGGRAKKTPRLVIEGEQEQINLIRAIHDVRLYIK